MVLRINKEKSEDYNRMLVNVQILLYTVKCLSIIGYKYNLEEKKQKFQNDWHSHQSRGSYLHSQAANQKRRASLLWVTFRSVQAFMRSIIMPVFATLMLMLMAKIMNHHSGLCFRIHLLASFASCLEQKLQHSSLFLFKILFLR